MTWLLARRAAQIGFIALFLSGPLVGVWIAKGTLASSLTFDVLPLTDPLVLLQSLAAGHWPEQAALIGAVLVLVAYLLVGGRVYCSWVCPVNLLTDAAAWARARLGLKEGVALDRRLRLWVLGGVLLASAVTGTIAWEFVNPVTMLHRALVFGTGGFAVLALLALFLFDFAVAPRGWCGHLCPVGAFYGLLGRFAFIRVGAPARAACDNCGDCFVVCPERHVLAPVLRGDGSPVILDGDCTNCGRCIDVCSKNVFAFSTRGVTAVNIKTMAIAVLLSLSFALTATAGEVKSLRPTQANTPDAAPDIFKVMDGVRHERAYRQQPPLVPHLTDKYEIDLKVNQCLRCHEWPYSNQEKAPKISDAHYVDRKGVRQDVVSGERYFCTQCHVPQADAKPLIANKFQPATTGR